MLTSTANQIESDAIYWKVGKRLVAPTDMAEIGLDQQFRRAFVIGKPLIHSAQRSEFLGGAILR